MKRLDTFEIQKNIEEKRLILAKKFKAFLAQKIEVITEFFSQIIAAKSTAFFGCLIITAISILAASSRDIGHNSAAYLEMVQKFVNGAQDHQNFSENSSLLVFYFTAIPHFLAQFFAISPIIALEIFVNLVGILSLYFSSKILEKSDVSKERAIFNLIILSFACGFFLRVFTLQFNEFGTESTYFLAFAFPYISYQLVKNLKNFDQILIGILAAILFCLKPHYGILVIVFEVAKIFEKKSFKTIFCLRNYLTISLIIFYFVFLAIPFSAYIAAISNLSDYVFLMLKEDLFPILLLIFLCFSLVKKNHFLYPFFLASISSLLIVISQLSANYDQRFVAYSLSLPFVVLTVFLIIKNNKISWRKDGFALFLILFIAQFDPNNFFAIALDIAAFWWLFVIILSLKWRNKKIQNDGFLKIIFLPRDVSSWFYFLLITATLIALSFNKNAAELFWIISAIIFALLINFYQKIHEEFSNSNKFSRLTSCPIFTVVAYFLSLHLSAIFNFSDSAAFLYKSPNHVNDQMIKIVKNYADESDEVTVIAPMISASYPALTYLKKTNNLSSPQMLALYDKITNSSEAKKAQSYLFSKLKQQLQNDKNKIIFIEKRGEAFDDRCQIGFLEYYLKDPEFRKIFLNNYVFLNRIIDKKTSQKEVNFFNDDQDSKSSQTPEIINRDVEVYIRK